MSAFFDKLNLRPQERRLVVFVAIVTFAVLNIWLVWPHFKDWRIIRGELTKVRETLGSYQKEIGKVADYEARLLELEGAGPNVIPEEQDLDFVRTVQSQTRASGISVSRSDPSPRTSSTSTNLFFEEQTLSLRFDAGNEELVKFLVNLASTNSLIRVQDLDLKPAARGGYKLSANLTLIASYQKNQPLVPQSNMSGTNSAAASPRSDRSGSNSARTSLVAKSRQN